MKVKTAKRLGRLVGITLSIVIIAAILGVSWGLTCLTVKLITLCFGWTFTLMRATGIWLVLFLLGGGPRIGSSVRK